MTTENKRIQSIDIMRGIIMVLMALDHTRDYFHIPASCARSYKPCHHYPYLILYQIYNPLLRTYFCVSFGAQHLFTGATKSGRELSIFLFTRGLWFVIMEITIVNFGGV
jgi:uncharacterized membrane protein